MGFVNMNSPEIRPIRECLPSERFIAAMQKYVNGEGNPKVSIIGNNTMRDVMRSVNEIPSQTYSFEIEFYGHNGTGHKAYLVSGIEKGLVAGEFLKSSDFGLETKERTVTIKQGRGIVILQKHAVDQNGNIIPDVVEEFAVVKVTTGEQIIIPSGYFYALVNTNKDDVLVAQHSSPRIKDSGNPNSQVLRNMRGFAYRVVAADSHVCLEPNKNYKKIKTLKDGKIPSVGQNLD
mgnify:CR=1 FL=1